MAAQALLSPVGLSFVLGSEERARTILGEVESVCAQLVDEASVALKRTDGADMRKLRDLFAGSVAVAARFKVRAKGSRGHRVLGRVGSSARDGGVLCLGFRGHVGSLEGGSMVVAFFWPTAPVEDIVASSCRGPGGYLTYSMMPRSGDWSGSTPISRTCWVELGMPRDQVCPPCRGSRFFEQCSVCGVLVPQGPSDLFAGLEGICRVREWGEMRYLKSSHNGSFINSFGCSV